ncbi:hypothetical protein CR513_55737, partial [Mucuna pruriens]
MEFKVGDRRKLELNELDKVRLNSYENAKIYKEWIKKCHDKSPPFFTNYSTRIFKAGIKQVTTRGDQLTTVDLPSLYGRKASSTLPYASFPLLGHERAVDLTTSNDQLSSTMIRNAQGRTKRRIYRVGPIIEKPKF